MSSIARETGTQALKRALFGGNRYEGTNKMVMDIHTAIQASKGGGPKCRDFLNEAAKLNQRKK